MAVTPAGAEVSQAVATNWKKIWKKEIKPLADKRYYKKSQSDSKYQAKGSYETAGSGYTKTESDAKYTGAGSSYTKAEADAKYAPAQPLYRGTLQLMGQSPGAGHGAAASVSWGATFPAALTPHYIRVGDPVPSGCSGTSSSPNASAGNFCVFESLASNVSTNRSVCRGGAPASCGTTDPWGAGIYTFSAGAGSFYVYGTWAARPSGPVVNPGGRSATTRDDATTPDDATTGGDPALGGS